MTHIGIDSMHIVADRLAYSVTYLYEESLTAYEYVHGENCMIDWY